MCVDTLNEQQAYLNNYIYDVAIYQGATDPLIKYLAATPVYVQAFIGPRPSGQIHITQRALLVLLHKLGLRGVAQWH